MKKAGRFVILRHTKAPVVHWDLMLESGRVLSTYRLDLPPEKLLHQKNVATKIFDHPMKFLSYQGPVNKGTGRVERVDAGTYQILRRDKDKLELQFNSGTLKGLFTLTRLDADRWEFICP